MRKELEPYAHIEEELIALLNTLLAELPSNVASLEVMRAQPKSNGVIAKLKPRNPAAASVVLHAENGCGIIDFCFGEYEPTWELPYEGSNPRPSKKELLQEVEQMCRAVMAGGCHHARRLFGVRGTILVGDQPSTVSHFFVLRPTPPLNGTRKYESYT